MIHARNDYNRFQDPATAERPTVAALLVAAQNLAAAARATAKLHRTVSRSEAIDVRLEPALQAYDAAVLAYDEVQKTLVSPGSTPIAIDEPVFLLRGQDLASPSTVLYWASLSEGNGVDPAVVTRVRDWAETMRTWQETHTARNADVPADQLRNA